MERFDTRGSMVMQSSAFPSSGPAVYLVAAQSIVAAAAIGTPIAFPGARQQLP
jgi:hypothetical protein